MVLKHERKDKLRNQKTERLTSRSTSYHTLHKGTQSLVNNQYSFRHKSIRM